MGTEDEIVRDSNPNASGPAGAAGDMGISSERVGPTGPGQVSTDGTREVRLSDSESESGEDDAAPPEQSPGNPEDNPEGIRPKAGYSSTDPRSD